MPGLGRKTFVAGDILTAAQVQGYLQDQTIMVFAGTAARSSAIGTPSTGMFTFITGTNQLQYWNGTTWTNFTSGGGSSGFETSFLLMGA